MKLIFLRKGRNLFIYADPNQTHQLTERSGSFFCNQQYFSDLCAGLQNYICRSTKCCNIHENIVLFYKIRKWFKNVNLKNNQTKILLAIAEIFFIQILLLEKDNWELRNKGETNWDLQEFICRKRNRVMNPPFWFIKVYD